LLAVALALAVLALATVVFVGSGAYNIGADDHHTRPVLALIGELRERSVAMRARSIEVPNLGEPARIGAGARRYASLCVGCHLAPGVTQSDVRRGLYPHPPNLAQELPADPRHAFWTIKHGIKMSAMPAWGRTLDDAEIWDVVAFVTRMPQLSAADYRQLTQ
jgi:mono/diheme cytochrome c family protein